jgi:membrane protease YdiL (CAAX protease family)
MGKVMALIATLVIAAHPAIGWSRAGLTLRQNPNGSGLTYTVMALTVLLFAALAFSQPNESVDADTLTFQLTMPGIEEETFYRGLLLFALNETFRGRWRIAAIDLGWGGIIATFLFGLTHALGYSDGAFSFDVMTMAMTGIPALILLWVRERTGSVAWPVILHNFANSASHLI